MITDGHEYEHDLTKRGAYDQLWAALQGAKRVTMLGDHQFPGGNYDLNDDHLGKVGVVTLTPDGKELLAGTWFGKVITAGRTQNRRQALAAMLDEIGSTHPGRVR